MLLKCSAYVEQRCRSCSIIEKEYEEGLSEKIINLKKLFPKIEIDEVIRTKSLIGYRNKAKFIVAGNLENPIIGIPDPKDKFKASMLLDCPLHKQELNDIAYEIKANIKEFLLQPYDLETKKGEFKYLIITSSLGKNEISIRFGMRSSESMPRVGKLAKSLILKFENIKVISFEIQPKHAAIFEGETSYILENKFIAHQFDGYQLLSSTTSFFQINSQVAQELYSRVFEYMKGYQIGTSLDLFCGVGGFSFEAAKFSRSVIGVELSENAIECAKQSLHLNDFKNLKFICDDAFNFKNYLGDEKCDLIIVNPPRRGIGEKFCELINQIGPKFLVYSSCNPDTLAQDATILSQKYKLKKLIPVDMFALTNHLEVLTFWEM